MQTTSSRYHALENKATLLSSPKNHKSKSAPQLTSYGLAASSPKWPEITSVDDRENRVVILSDASNRSSSEVVVPSREHLRKLPRHQPAVPTFQTDLARLFYLQSLIAGMGFAREKALISLLSTDARSVEAAVDFILSQDEWVIWHPFEEYGDPELGTVDNDKDMDVCAKCRRPARQHVITMKDMNEAMNTVEPPSNLLEGSSERLRIAVENQHIVSDGILWSPSNAQPEYQNDGEQISRANHWTRFINPDQDEKKIEQKTHVIPSESGQGYFSSNRSRCLICFQEKPELELGWAVCESHPDRRFCVNCLRMYYKYQVEDGEVLRVVCPDPNCQREILEDEIISYLTPELVKKYHRFKEIRLIQLCKNARFCSVKDCEGWMIGSCMKRKLSCKTCNTPHCFKCGNRWHGWLSKCDRGTDLSYALWSMGKAICKCPNCKARIWKDGGCNHMTCRYCKHEFCWICKGRYSYGHFNSWNLWGCPGMDNSSTFIRCPSCFPPLLNRCLIILCVPIWIIPCVLLAMVLIPVGLVILVITIPFRCIYYAFCD